MKLVDEETQRKIAAAYRAGKKLRDIEEAFGVTRSQVYWSLDQQHVAPARTKPKSRLDDGNPLTVERLYQIMEAQDQRLQMYEDLLSRVLGSLAAFADALQADMSDEQIAAMRSQVSKLTIELGTYGTDQG